MRKESGRFWLQYDKIQRGEITDPVFNLNGSLYAVLFNAKEGRSSRNIRLVYHSLIDSGVLDQDIVVLEGDGHTKNRFVDHPATARNLEGVIDSIRQRGQPSDRLLVYVTNHGELINGRCNVETCNGFLWEEDFEQIMQDLPLNFGVFCFVQCYSGGFAERMGNGRNIGISATTKEGISLIGKYGDDFTRGLFPKILDQDTTIEQAFDLVVKTNTNLIARGFFPRKLMKRVKGPQLYWQNANPSKLNLNRPYQQQCLL